MRYTHDCWSIDLPDHWQCEEDEEEDIVEFFHPDGVGTFDVSSYFKEEGEVTLADIAEFAEEDNLETTDLPYLNGYYKKVIEDGESIFQWWLCTANHLIYATYVCDQAEEAVEEDERHGLITSLRSHYG